MQFIISLLMVIVMVNSDYHSTTVAQKDWEIKSSIGCPCGLIEMWYGPLEAIPPGFQLCDGTNFTPDLRNRFVIGAGLDFPLGANGGSNSITVGIENMPAHKHEVKYLETTSDGHYHTHNLKAGTSGNHYHGVNIYTTEAGAHDHQLQATVHPESGHVHGIPQLYTGADGQHDHQMQAFIDNDYATNKVAGVKAEWILDGDQPLSMGHNGYPGKTIIDRTLPDGLHSHVIPPDSTDGGSYHTHDIDGKVDTGGPHKHGVMGATADNGEHSHTISGEISGGVHTHKVSGMTELYGHGTPITYLPPYYAVYYICCIRPPLYPDKTTSYTTDDGSSTNNGGSDTNNNDGSGTNNNNDPDTYAGNDNSGNDNGGNYNGGSDNGGSDNSGYNGYGRYSNGYNRQYGGYGYGGRYN